MHKSCIISSLLLMGTVLPALAQAPAVPVSPPPHSAAAISRDITVIKGNVQTVEELVRFENELALAKLENERRAAAAKRGVPVGGPAKPKGPPPMVMTVQSIHGLPGHLRANVVANGQGITNLTAGSEVGVCRVQAIHNRCVVLAPRTRSTLGKSRVRAPALSCPTTCWTGIEEPSVSGVNLGMPPMAGGPLPMPPGVPGSVALPR